MEIHFAETTTVNTFTAIFKQLCSITKKKKCYHQYNGLCYQRLLECFSSLYFHVPCQIKNLYIIYLHKKSDILNNKDIKTSISNTNIISMYTYMNIPR